MPCVHGTKTTTARTWLTDRKTCECMAKAKMKMKMKMKPTTGQDAGDSMTMIAGI